MCLQEKGIKKKTTLRSLKQGTQGLKRYFFLKKHRSQRAMRTEQWKKNTQVGL